MIDWYELGFEEYCPECNGRGYDDYQSITGQTEKKFCENCLATGTVPSETGRKLIEFIRKEEERQRIKDLRR